MTGNAAEIAKIEHELEILRSRYAIFAYWSKVVKWVCVGAVVIVLGLILALGIFRDVVLAFMAFIIAVIAGTIYLAYRREWRWIDTVSPAPGWPYGRMFNIGPRSEAAAIESLIAEREARLAELKVHNP